jgi:hypothetical protein
MVRTVSSTQTISTYLLDIVTAEITRPYRIYGVALTQVGIGACAIPGVRIGERTIVGAGAAVVTDIPDDVVAVGVPAKVIKRRQ